MAHFRKEFTADEICSIIKAVGESRLSYLRVGSLEIQTTSHDKPRAEVQGWTEAPSQPAIAVEQKTPSQDSPPQGLKPDREDELDQALIEDPVTYEAAVIRGELDGKDT